MNKNLSIISSAFKMAKTAINVFYNEAHMIVSYITIFSLHMQAYVVVIISCVAIMNSRSHYKAFALVTGR